MQRGRLMWAIPVIVAIWGGLTIACVAAVGAAGSVPPLVAQAATVAPTSSAVTAITPVASSLATAPSASSAATPPVAATVDTGSAVAPPEPLPVVDTSSGPDRGQVIITLVGIVGALILIPLGTWGLIRLIATAGR